MLHLSVNPDAETLDVRPIGKMPISLTELSKALKYDVKQLIIAGYTWQQIERVWYQEISIHQLLLETPDQPPIRVKR
jgi:hypothetical protein